MRSHEGEKCGVDINQSKIERERRKPDHFQQSAYHTSALFAPPIPHQTDRDNDRDYPRVGLPMREMKQ